VSITIPVPVFDLVIFGGTGDLARRKLLPALYHRMADGQVPGDSRILAAGRQPLTIAEYRASVRSLLEASLAADELDARKLDAFLSRIDYQPIDLAADAGWAELKRWLGERGNRVQVFYLAVSPDLYGPACEQLRAHGLNAPQARIVVEKPIGHDLESARHINATLASVFSEAQTYRIDHYLGKETVQNLVALRFGNALFEPLWNAAHIDHVQITVAEQLGLEGRHTYYERAGALRDMVQNHLLQLVCFVAMEPPQAFVADAVRDEKLKVLRALKPIENGDVGLHTVRGQYRAGASCGAAVPGYLEEVGASRSSTDTFAAIRAEIANWRWSGVPFYLRTGKRLPQRVSEIVVSFRAVRHSVFGAAGGPLAPNKLIIRLQPDEAVQLGLMIKEPGPGGLRLRSTSLDMSFAETFGHRRHPDAYERLIMDVVRGNATLFMRRDEVEAAWAWVDPILAAWADSGDAPRSYVAGSWGPSAAVALVERDGRTWHEEEVFA
jgi:glucose-6-phosphate 1-dehydrogenase